MKIIINKYNYKYERRDIIKIKIFGSDSPKGIKLKKEIINIAKKQNLDVDILEMNDKKNIRKYKILQTPTLVINDEIKYDVKEINNNILKRIIMLYSS